jgi:predicted NBD/HSP70 family sugar kinase
MPATAQTAIAVIGIDIGKNSFHIVGLDDRGTIVLCQKWSRSSESHDGTGRPCSEIDGFSTHYSRRHIRVGSGAGVPRQTRSCGRDIPDGSSR